MNIVQPDVSIVIVTHNSAGVVGDLLKSIPSALGGLVAETILVDNASTDSTLAVVSTFAECQVIQSENVGYAGGINRGVAAAARETPVLVLNPDLRLHPTSINALVMALNKPRVGIVAPRVESSSGQV